MGQQLAQEIPQQIAQKAKVIGDVVATSGVVATLVGWLPAIAAGLSIIWTLIRIYETATVQKWLNKRREPPA